MYSSLNNVSSYNRIFCCEIWLYIFDSLELGKIFSRVPTHQGPILALVYHGYTKTKKVEGKTSLFTHAETFDIFIICIQVALKGIYRCVSIDEICTQCSMNKQYVKVNTKTEKGLLESVIVMLALNDRERVNSS